MTPQERSIFEMFMKVLGNQSLIMLGLATLCESEKARESLHEQALKTSNEITEAIAYLKKQ